MNGITRQNMTFNSVNYHGNTKERVPPERENPIPTYLLPLSFGIMANDIGRGFGAL